MMNRICKYVFLLWGVLSCILLYVGPYFFPQKEATQSLSYNVGFNNAVGFMILGGICCFLIGFGYFYRSNMSVPHFWISFKNKDNQLLLWSGIFITLLLLLFEYILLNREEFYGINESSTFFRYNYALSHGIKVYRDIQGLYGPLFIYPTYLLTLLGLGLTSSYFIILAIYHSIGLIFLYDLLSHTVLCRLEKRLVFISCAVALFPWTLGLNYCLLRCVLVLWLFKAVTLSNSNSFFVCVYILLSTFFALNCSPELGICLSTGFVIYYVIRFVLFRKSVYLTFSLCPISVLLLTVYLIPNYLTSVVQAGSGGYNFPYVPNLILTFLFFSLFAISVYAGKGIKNLKENLWQLAMTLMAVMTLPYSLGRCDNLHVLLGSFFVLIMGMYYLKTYFHRYIVYTFFVLSILSYVMFHARAVALNIIYCAVDINTDRILSIKDFSEKHSLPFPSFIDKNRLKKHRYTYANSPDDYDLLVGLTSTTCISTNNLIYEYLYAHSDFKETYYGVYLDWVGTKDGLQKEMCNLREIDVDYIILPRYYLQRCLSYSDMQYVTLFFSTYYNVKEYRHFNNELYGDMVKFIEDHYSIKKYNNKLEVWKKKGI